MNRNSTYLVTGVFVTVSLILGILLYQEQQKTSGIELNVGKGGISVETK